MTAQRLRASLVATLVVTLASALALTAASVPATADSGDDVLHIGAEVCLEFTMILEDNEQLVEPPGPGCIATVPPPGGEASAALGGQASAAAGGTAVLARQEKFMDLIVIETARRSKLNGAGLIEITGFHVSPSRFLGGIFDIDKVRLSDVAGNDFGIVQIPGTFFNISYFLAEVSRYRFVFNGIGLPYEKKAIGDVHFRVIGRVVNNQQQMVVEIVN